MKRRLAAILVADAAGYSRLMAADEVGTAARMAACRQLADSEISGNEGRVFKTMGDSVLAEFASPLNALQSAVRIRDALSIAEKERDPPLKLRFGLHLADVLVEGNDLIGDGVNLAARIQQGADPGAIDVSAALFEQIRRISPFSFEDRGEQAFKNIGEPVHIYRLRGEINRHRYQITPTQFAPQPQKRPHSIAVVPFESPPGDEDHQYLADGISEELVFELGRFRKLFLASHLATRAMGGQHLDVKAVGDRFGVRYVLTGSLRMLGPKIRLSLTLSETEGGTVVWADRVTQAFAELVDRLDELVSRVASTVLGRIEDSDIAVARRLKPESMTAYEFHLRGLECHRLGGITDANVREAVGWFRRAIEADPNFARPYAMLTCAASNLPDFDYAEGLRNVERALELDPNDPEANRIMGSLRLGTQEFEASRRFHEKAMELSPSDAYIKGRSAAFYNFVGEPERALELLDMAAALDPFLPVWCVEERVAAHYLLGRHGEALSVGRSLPFQTRRSRLYRAATRMAQGEIEHARRIIAEALVAAPELTAEFARYRECYRDPVVKQTLIDRLVAAGLPDRAHVEAS